MRNCNELFTENVFYDNIKSHKKAGLFLPSTGFSCVKTTCWSNLIKCGVKYN